MFHDPSNIFAPPPDTNVIGEMNIGAVFQATYHKLVIDPFKDMISGAKPGFICVEGHF
jgi:hypothetical protein